MVLNDGETYSDLEGCKIVFVASSVGHIDEAVKEAFKGDTPDIGVAKVVTEFS